MFCKYCMGLENVVHVIPGRNRAFAFLEQIRTRLFSDIGNRDFCISVRDNKLEGKPFAIYNAVIYDEAANPELLFLRGRVFDDL